MLTATGIPFFFSALQLYFLSSRLVMLPCHNSLPSFYQCNGGIRIIKIYIQRKQGREKKLFCFCFFYSGLFTLNVLFTLLSIFIYLVIFCSADIYEQLFRKII